MDHEEVLLSSKTKAWLLVTATGSTVVASGLLIFIGPESPTMARLVWLFASVSYAAAGLFLATKVPGNRLSWALLLGALLSAISQFAEVYPAVAIENGMPGAVVTAVLQGSFFFPALAFLVPIPAMLFPDGELPGRRWRWLGWMAATLVFSGFLNGAISPGPLEALNDTSLSGLENPVGIGFLGGEPTALDILVLLSFVGTFLGAAAAMARRFRTSSGEQRLQLKWFAYASVWAALGLVAFILLALIEANSSIQIPSWIEPVAVLMPLLAVLMLPISIGLSISRYRLYDIDHLISRTFTYALLAGLLGAIYAAGVFILGSLPFEGGLPVAASTLVVAALFNPLRRRIQTRIDRRFARTSYDPKQVIDEFIAKTESEVNMEALAEILLETVEEALRPAEASIWVRTG